MKPSHRFLLSVLSMHEKKNAKVGIRHFTAKRKLPLRNMSAISSKYASDLRKMSFERFWTENELFRKILRVENENKFSRKK